MSYDGDKTLYIADSESSTVRSVELPSFVVKNVAGGGFDPTDLFSYGDQDGKGECNFILTCSKPINIVSPIIELLSLLDINTTGKFSYIFSY